MNRTPQIEITDWEAQLIQLAAKAGSATATQAVDKLTAAMRDAAAERRVDSYRRPVPPPPPQTWPTLQRTAEHIVADFDASSAATTHGTLPLPEHRLVGWVERLAADRIARVIGRFPLLEVGAMDHFAGGGIAKLPTFTTAPTAGPQGGQKQEAPSHAFVVGPDDAATLIDAALYLNISMHLDVVAHGITEQLMRLAVVAEAESQVVAALEAGATTGSADLGAALGTFTAGMYTPGLLVMPPGSLLDQAANINALTAVGIAVALSPFSTLPVLVDPAAVTGYLVELSLDKLEPSVVGKQHAEQLYGQVSIAADGAASFTA